MSEKKTNIAVNEFEQNPLSAMLSSGIKGMQKKYKVRFIIVIVLLVVAVAAVAFTSYKLITRVKGGMTPQGIREISQLATIEYRYKDVIIIDEEQEFKILGWDIDPGESILIVQYEGIIKLGINCEDIKFNEYEPDENGRIRIEIKLPPAVIISSETPLASFETVMDRGIFTKKKIDTETFFNIAGERQEQTNADVINGDLGKTARDNAKKQLQAMFDSFAEISENYDIVWMD